MANGEPRSIRYSFLLVGYNHWNLTRQAIQTLVASLDRWHLEAGVELLVVDNGSTDETATGLEALANDPLMTQLQFRPLRTGLNIGFPSALNYGLSHATGEIITIAGNDAIFPKGWFDDLAATLEADTLIGIVSPFVTNASGPQHLDVTFETVEAMASFATRFMNDNRGRVIYTDRLVTVCVSFRRDLLATVGGFDFWFGIGGCDDDDWSLRARMAGYKLAVCGGSFVYHIGSATYKTDGDWNATLSPKVVRYGRKWDLAMNNNRGSFSVAGAIQHTPYRRDTHFIPVQSIDFSQSDAPFYPRNGAGTRLLLVTDWTDPQYHWGPVLYQYLAEMNEGDEIALWIPASHYDPDETAERLDKVVAEVGNKPMPEVTVCIDPVPPVRLLRVLKSFDGLIAVPADCVNRSLSFMAKQIGLPVIEHPKQITSLEPVPWR